MCCCPPSRSLPAVLLLLAGVVVVAPLEAQECAGEATYDVRFNAVWSASTHPVAFPPGPHFSGLVGGVHGDSVSFWTEGGVASPGIERMAELGSKTPLLDEVSAAVDAGTAQSELSGPGLPSSPGSRHFEFLVTAEFPLVTLVTMVAPSPDWFVGVDGLSLCAVGKFVDELVVDLWPYDAGTDAGVSYTSSNKNQMPKKPIEKITDGPLGNGEPLGTFRFTKTSDSIIFEDGFESGDTSAWSTPSP